MTLMLDGGSGRPCRPRSWGACQGFDEATGAIIGIGNGFRIRISCTGMRPPEDRRGVGRLNLKRRGPPPIEDRHI